MRTIPTTIRAYIPYAIQHDTYPSIGGIGAIGDFETFDDSRLRRNFASVVCEGQCKPSVVEHSLRATASVRCEGDNAVSFGRFVGNKAAKTTLLGLLCSSMSAQPPPKSRVKWKKVCETESAKAASDSHPICPQPHRRDERPDPYLRRTVSA